MTIKDDWVNDGETLRVRQGKDDGRVFLLPGFRSTSFNREKAPGTLRLFVLGGSTVFGLGVGGDESFVAQLQRQLEAVFPEQSVEAINLGCPGWASDRVASLMPKLLDLSPDLIIVYSGHNEMLRGHVGVPMDWRSGVSARVLRWSAIVSWLHYGLSQRGDSAMNEVLQEEELAAAHGQTPVFDPMLKSEGRRQLPTSEFLAAAEAQFARNLRSMSRDTSDAEVPLLLVLPVANLLFPPAYSMHPAGIDTTTHQDLSERVQIAVAAGRTKEALSWADKAAAASPRYAMTHYWRGILLSRLSRTEDARAAFQRAADRDVRTHRITSGLESVFVETAQETQVPWVDLRQVFQGSLDLTSARVLFVDHVHPTQLGHELIADALTPEVSDALAPTREKPP